MVRRNRARPAAGPWLNLRGQFATPARQADDLATKDLRRGARVGSMAIAALWIARRV